MVGVGTIGDTCFLGEADDDDEFQLSDLRV